MKYTRKTLGSKDWEETDSEIIIDDLYVLTGFELPGLPELPFEVTIGNHPDRSYSAKGE